MLGYVLILLYCNTERIILIISTCFHKFLLLHKVMKGVTATLTEFGPSSTVCLPGCGLFSVCDVTVTPEGPSLTWWMLGNTQPPSLWSHLQPSTELIKVKTNNLQSITNIMWSCDQNIHSSKHVIIIIIRISLKNTTVWRFVPRNKYFYLEGIWVKNCLG